MGPIPPDKQVDEITREMVAEVLARRKAREAAGVPDRSYPAARVSRLIRDLIARFEKDGRADPAVAREMVAELRREVDGGA